MTLTAGQTKTEIRRAWPASQAPAIATGAENPKHAIGIPLIPQVDCTLAQWNQGYVLIKQQNRPTPTVRPGHDWVELHKSIGGTPRH